MIILTAVRQSSIAFCENCGGSGPNDAGGQTSPRPFLLYGRERAEETTILVFEEIPLRLGT